MKTFKKYVAERQMSTPQKVQQMNFYWKDLDHLASDEMKKKNMQKRFGIKNIKLDPRKGKILSFDEEVDAHAKVMAKKGDSAKTIKKMHPEITDDELESIMGKKEERDYKSTKKAIKYHADEARNYRKEYDNYHAQPEQRERNAARLRARRQMVKAGKVEKFDKKDVHHKDNNPLNNKEDNLAVTTQNWNRTEPRLRKEEVKVDEKVEYYLDTSKDDTTKYVATDGDYWYTGKVGMKGGSAFLKFAATRISRSYFERAKLKKASPKEIEKDALKKPSIISTVDFKKLYTK